MNETPSAIGPAFVAALAPYQITLTLADANDLCHVIDRYQSCMTWLATVEQWLSFGQSFKRPPECLSRFLTDEQREGVRESYLPPKRVTPKPLPAQKGFHFGD